MPVSEWTEDQLRTWVDDKYDEEADGAWIKIQRWLDRGDGAAVYENHDLGHPEVGAPQIASYGSAWAQLEVETPPERLPDIGGAINWRYQLIATCRRQPAPEVQFDVDLSPAKPGPDWEWPE